MTIDAECDNNEKSIKYTGVYDAIGHYQHYAIYVKQTPNSNNKWSVFYKMSWFEGDLDLNRGQFQFDQTPERPEVGSFLGDPSVEVNQILPFRENTHCKYEC